ncbi:MAG: hypothetical protein KME13_09295 [Myxacorys californica WJT36-NPBG1]|nr:hypothetical protein [Myxacorys californica WJT36-NPBG1]
MAIGLRQTLLVGRGCELSSDRSISSRPYFFQGSFVPISVAAERSR